MHQDSPQKIEYGTLRSYVLGFSLSILLTLTAYFLVVAHFLTGLILDLATAGLALIQALVQLVLFLNLIREPKPRWNLIIFLFMTMIVLIIVFGSLWIMNNLNYNLMND
ncbi:MAG: cytochrome o ubiquinol oxidase subunit IV [Chlamydiota bacterium]